MSTPALPPTPLPAAVQHFLACYRDAFNRLDGQAVAALYAVPSAIVDSERFTHWGDAEAIVTNMVSLCRLYKDNGFDRAEFTPRQWLVQNERFCVVDVQWHIRRTANQEPWRFRTTYNLVQQGEGWRIVLCTAYSEERLNARDTPC